MSICGSIRLSLDRQAADRIGGSHAHSRENQDRTQGAGQTAPMAVSRAAADDCQQSLKIRNEGNVCGSEIYKQDVFGVRCDRKEKEAPVRMSLWLPSAQRPECRSKSARSGLFADDPGAGRKQA